MSKKKVPEKLQTWIDARQRYKLSHAQVQMARELGLNPKNFGGLANSRQERWKMPLPQFIEHLYFKHFSKTVPDREMAIEESHAAYERKKREKKALKLKRKQSASESDSADQPGQADNQLMTESIQED